MAKFSDTIDLYDDQGKLLKSGVALDKVSPLTNAGIKKMISLTKRTVAVNLGGAEAFLKTGKAGKNQIPGRELNLDLVANAGAIKEKMFKMLQVTEGDDTEIKEFGGGKLGAAVVYLHAARAGVQPQDRQGCQPVLAFCPAQQRPHARL